MIMRNLVIPILLFATIAMAQPGGGSYQLEQTVIVSGGGQSNGGTNSLQSTSGQTVAGGFSLGGPRSAYFGFLYPSLIPTAAGVTVEGRVLGQDGNGIAGARIVALDPLGEMRLSVSSSMGYYRFDDLPVGLSYFFSVRSKRYTFPERVIALHDSIVGLDFVADP